VSFAPVFLPEVVTTRMCILNIARGALQEISEKVREDVDDSFVGREGRHIFIHLLSKSEESILGSKV